jgi:LmbE family N-acetylglucosaminyl deacetylase
MDEERTGSVNEQPTRIRINELLDLTTMTVELPVPKVVLAVGAHPDDIEFGCGGTLAKWASQGAELHHLVLTDGSKGTWDPGRDLARLVAERQEEQREAARALGGGDVGFLGWPDGELRNGVREQWEVCRWIRTVRPDVVMGHDPWRRYRLHPDHRNAGFILVDALVAARDPHFFPDQELEPHRPKDLLLWEADLVNHIEDVSAYADQKIAGLLAHRSQLQSTMEIDPSLGGTERDDALGQFRQRVFDQLREHGALGGVEIGEAFHLSTDL